MSDILSVAWKRYLDNLQKNPITTKSATSGTISALSNVTAQKLLSNAPINWRRALAMGAFGALITAPATHFWHKFLDSLFPKYKKNGEENTNVSIKKLVLDLFTFGPLINLLAFAYISTVVDGRSLAFTRSKIEQEFPSVLANAFKFWPVVHFVNYKYVPGQLRVPFVSASAYFWSVFLIVKAKASLSIRTA